MANPRKDLPAWTELAGGRDEWQRWVNRKTAACVARAKTWAQNRPQQAGQLPSRREWQKAIMDALHNSAGRGKYSNFPLSLASKTPTAWYWPSVDHLEGPPVAKVVLETRLVNDMKSIMSEKEFKDLIGHLAAVLGVKVKEQEDWQCRRSFAAEESSKVEPPLSA